MPAYFSIPTSAYPQSYTMGVLDKINKRGAYAPPGTRTAPGTAGPVTGYDPRYGGVPSAPVPGTEALNAILANLKNLSDLTKLTTETGKANAGAARAALLASVPQFDALMGQFQQNVGAGSRGELSPSLRAQINQNLAEAGVAGGSPGGPSADAARLRAMGLASEEVQRRALQDMATMTSLAPTGVPVDAGKMQIDPTTQLIWQWLANQLAAAPIPGAAREDELRRQLEAIRAGIAAGTTPFGQAGGSKQQDLSWLKDIINRSPATTGQGNVPPGTTDANTYSVTGPPGTISTSGYSWIPGEMDLFDTGFNYGTGGAGGLGAYDIFQPGFGQTDANNLVANTKATLPFIPTLPYEYDYFGGGGGIIPGLSDFTGFGAEPFATGEPTLPDDYYAFPEWY